MWYDVVTLVLAVARGRERIILRTIIYIAEEALRHWQVCADDAMNVPIVVTRQHKFYKQPTE